MLLSFNQPKTLSGIETAILMTEKLENETGFNQPKTLSGIETGLSKLVLLARLLGFNQPKTLSGIETAHSLDSRESYNASTNPKPFQGLKQIANTPQGFDRKLQPTQNPFRDWNSMSCCKKLEDSTSFNQPKTLSGIETEYWLPPSFALSALQPTQNPFRDWNRKFFSDRALTLLASTNPKPFQGLKPKT